MTKRKIFLFLFLPLIVLAIVVILKAYFFSASPALHQTPAPPQSDLNNNPGADKNNSSQISPEVQNNPGVKNASGFLPPLNRASERVTKKPFGIFITSQNSPVSPEKFYGYHTGTDFEIFPEELNVDVPVSAICDGKLALKKYASGYGGVAVESCSLDGASVTIIYGHLKLASINFKVGEKISAGDELGILGANDSPETDGERKHLHLGVHKGTSINILGYVQAKSALSDWIDGGALIGQE